MEALPRPVAADWLAVREPVDAAARAPMLPALREWAAQRRSVEVVDVGSGPGANLRHLAPVLREAGVEQQRWLLVDHDARLLERDRSPVARDVVVRRQVGTLGDLPDQLRGTPLDLVTCSALLDLLDPRDADALVEVCLERGAAALLALSVDGGWRVDPPHPLDAVVADAFEQHQAEPWPGAAALGSRAWGYVADAFGRAGWSVTTVATPWRLGPDQAAMARRFLVDRHDAVRELAQRRDEEELTRHAHEWLEDRLRDLDGPGWGIEVGHVDLLAVPSRG